MLCNSGELEVDVEFSCRMRQCALRPPTDGGQRLRAASLPAHASHVRTVGAVIPRDRLQEIVAQVDSTERLDPDVEEALMEVAEDFVENVTTFACSLAKHRRSTVVEAQDVQLHLERSWNIVVPGFTAVRHPGFFLHSHFLPPSLPSPPFVSLRPHVVFSFGSYW